MNEHFLINFSLIYFKNMRTGVFCLAKSMFHFRFNYIVYDDDVTLIYTPDFIFGQKFELKAFMIHYRTLFAVL